MNILVIANTNTGEVKEITGKNSNSKQYAVSNDVLQAVADYMDRGYALVSSSGGVYTLKFNTSDSVRLNK